MFVARCGDFNNLLVIDLKPSHFAAVPMGGLLFTPVLASAAMA
jgi:hypothetical protein